MQLRLNVNTFTQNFPHSHSTSLSSDFLSERNFLQNGKLIIVIINAKKPIKPEYLS